MSVSESGGPSALEVKVLVSLEDAVIGDIEKGVSQCKRYLWFYVAFVN